MCITAQGWGPEHVLSLGSLSVILKPYGLEATSPNSFLFFFFALSENKTTAKFKSYNFRASLSQIRYAESESQTHLHNAFSISKPKLNGHAP